MECPSKQIMLILQGKLVKATIGLLQGWTFDFCTVAWGNSHPSATVYMVWSERRACD